MKKLVNKDDTVTLVNVSTPSISNLAHFTSPMITIDRKAKAETAGEKVIRVCSNKEYRISNNINQADVNVLNLPANLTLDIHRFPLYINAVAIFTSDVSDDEIKEKARQWCSEIIIAIQHEISQITLNLNKLSDLSSDANALLEEK